ncbi:tRNA pseudouridine synthase A [Anatilimnocola aggregata]|uniref:tRNA pseudouridine synthase A n=1 Tax=Anatilimnocola aggregata TaxID=2528021 RepID=A0A517YBE6_9BACT|nr:tRNA pseudouridine(38-40) synthase TruA [Anatilimnocola aggregata]QDU27499.1 tRNA pseudouridine synthase A [Anatilimnocola aggregata]
MPTFKLTLAYDGTDFGGWQWQPNSRTVQAELEKAIERITQQKVRCTASGRTDAGVHALGQVVSFQCETGLNCDVLRKGINAELPDDMIVCDLQFAPAEFHAIRDAVRKRYRYVVQDGRLRDIFAREYVWHVRQKLDERLMWEASRALIGTHDFKSYQSTGSMRLTTERTILDLLVERREAELTSRVIIEVEANGFLYNMVRNIVGTLVQIGKGLYPVSFAAEALAACDRRAAGMTAPAQGLFLIGVEYDGYDDPEMSASLRAAHAAANATELANAEMLDE